MSDNNFRRTVTCAVAAVLVVVLTVANFVHKLLAQLN